MRRTLALLLLLLAACETPPRTPQYTLTQAHADCLAVPFDFFSGCVQSKMQDNAPEWVVGPDADLIQVYYSWTSAAGQRVTHGELDELVAQTQATNLLNRLVMISRQRKNAPKPIDWGAALAGFALMNAASQPGPTIVCRTVDTGLGTTTTTCQ